MVMKRIFLVFLGRLYYVNMKEMVMVRCLDTFYKIFVIFLIKIVNYIIIINFLQILQISHKIFIKTIV